MLIQKQVSLEVGAKMGFRLGTGEEIVGEVKSVNSNDIVLSRVKRLVITQQGMGLAPFLMLSDIDADVTLSRQHIQAYYSLSADTESDYIRVATGIQI